MAKTFTFKIKCMACSLHYEVHSWKHDWIVDRKIFCPECGVANSKMIWQEPGRDREIYELVPGGADLVQMT